MSRRHPTTKRPVSRSLWAALFYDRAQGGYRLHRSPDADGCEVPWVLHQNRSPQCIARDRAAAMRGRRAARANR